MAVNRHGDAALSAAPGALPTGDHPAKSQRTSIDADALIVGAGPVGLFQVFELGLLGIGAHVVDSLPQAGGQCIELYADKPIYDIPGTVRCTGRELIDRLLQQIRPFDAGFHFGQEVSALQSQPDGRFRVVTSAGAEFVANTVFIAGGVGSFQPRRLKIEGLQEHEGRQLFYRAGDPARFAGANVVVIGDDDGALGTAIALAESEAGRAASVTLMHRRDGFRAEPATVARLRACRDRGAVRFIAAQPRAVETASGRLVALVVDTADGATQRVPLDCLLALTGLNPKLGPIADWGLALERKQLVVDTARFETSVPGIFAVGDVNTYPGKKKLILSGFHEAALAAFAAAARIHPERPSHLEYTTSSPRLQRLLGVAPSAQSA